MPTTLLQVPRRTFGRLRGVPQVSWHLLWRLRESRRSPGIYFGVCGYSRKSPGIYFGVCGSPANLSAFALTFAGTPASFPAFTLAFAGVPQVSRRLPWRLRESRKCFGELVGRYNMLSMIFSMNKEPHSFVELTLRKTNALSPQTTSSFSLPRLRSIKRDHASRP